MNRFVYNVFQYICYNANLSGRVFWKRLINIILLFASVYSFQPQSPPCTHTPICHSLPLCIVTWPLFPVYVSACILLQPTTVASFRCVRTAAGSRPLPLRLAFPSAPRPAAIVSTPFLTKHSTSFVILRPACLKKNYLSLLCIVLSKPILSPK